MSVNCREIQGGLCEITQNYKAGAHNGIDIVNKGYTLGNIVAHSDGIVVGYRRNHNSFESGSYGNYVKIKHNNGYYTLYAHMAYNTVTVTDGQRVTKGQVLGYMGNTGESYGGHLHFEVRNDKDVRIDPTPYLNSDLPGNAPAPKPTPTPTGERSIGEVVTINGVYVSSDSTERLNPLITKGPILKIIKGARNPYLVGTIGWVNDSCITSGSSVIIKTITNCSWLNLRTSASYGNNIYKAVEAGTKVEYYGMENGWAKIGYNNQILYCGSSYLA